MPSTRRKITRKSLTSLLLGLALFGCAPKEENATFTFQPENEVGGIGSSVTKDDFKLGEDLPIKEISVATKEGIEYTGLGNKLYMKCRFEATSLDNNNNPISSPRVIRETRWEESFSNFNGNNLSQVSYSISLGPCDFSRSERIKLEIICTDKGGKDDKGEILVVNGDYLPQDGK